MLINYNIYHKQQVKEWIKAKKKKKKNVKEWNKRKKKRKERKKEWWTRDDSKIAKHIQ